MGGRMHVGYWVAHEVVENRYLLLIFAQQIKPIYTVKENKTKNQKQNPEKLTAHESL